MARHLRIALIVVASFCAVALIAGAAGAKRGGGLLPLSAEPVPAPTDVQKFIRDTKAASKLGKALFWDMQAGSDGKTACASCHYDAGADSRSRNQLAPRGAAFEVRGANAQLSEQDFPIRTNDVVGSQGVLPSVFRGVADGDPFELQTPGPLHPNFHVGAFNVRQVTGRNAPSVVNAVFNFRQFWDGRAQNVFNGVNPAGAADIDARVAHVTASGDIAKVPVAIANASLASQATGPPGSPVEMSAEGRTLSDIGRKLLTLRPLGLQEVSASDSLLGSDADDDGMGLRVSYSQLIREAFQPEWWDATGSVDAPNGRSYSLMQFNFPLFWGLAIEAYESTLVSDKTPFDRFLGGEPAALSTEAKQGMSVFGGKGECSECHNGAALTSASTTAVMAEADPASGFVNIGVRPTANDGGLAGGTFKVPGLRNVALTAPYFHNGGQATLRQVVDFYDRGGDFANPEKDPHIQPLGMTEAEKSALVAFLESLTDPRVRDHAAPFDHPQLLVPAGAVLGPDKSLLRDSRGDAMDCLKEVPATGAAGGSALPRFPGFTGPPCFTPTARAKPAPAEVPVDAVVVRVPAAAPARRTCVSRRSFSMRLYRPRGERIRHVTVHVNGRRVVDVRGRALTRAPINLRGLPRGVIRVKVIARTSSGRQLRTQRVYRTCATS